MITMQYSFVLPADYDMSIIERRVQEKGHMLDHHHSLVFKAYLVAQKGESTTQSQVNLYAPFYLWHENEAMRDFLCGDPFVGLVHAFGWPVVHIWPAVLATAQADDLRGATFASREIEHIPAFTSLETLQRDEHLWVTSALQEAGVLAALSAFEPTTWTLVRFRLWEQPRQAVISQGAQAYHVLHVSHPGHKQAA